MSKTARDYLQHGEFSIKVVEESTRLVTVEDDKRFGIKLDVVNCGFSCRNSSSSSQLFRFRLRNLWRKSQYNNFV